MTRAESHDSSPPRRKRSSRKPWIIGLMIAIIGGSIWLWEDVLEDRLIPKRWGVVEAGVIYRSGQLSPALSVGTGSGGRSGHRNIRCPLLANCGHFFNGRIGPSGLLTLCPLMAQSGHNRPKTK